MNWGTKSSLKSDRIWEGWKTKMLRWKTNLDIKKLLIYSSCNN